ncbi:MAG: hypothetical protein Q9M40_11810 [Sulfurimonas sp.]|nr:hypothetical protein [Sulfurimonas sp.]
MKLIFISLALCLNILNADEIQRIESIVNDISKLRAECENAKSALAQTEIKLKEEQEKNRKLSKDLEVYKQKNISLKNKTIDLEKALKTKEKNKIICKTKTIEVIKNRIIIQKDLNTKSFSQENKFPNLLMKEEFKIHKDDNKASTYRVKVDAYIYDGVDGEKIFEWEKSTSFTSNERTKDWIKITGYFVDKVWRASSDEMWIKSSDAFKREN